MSETFRIENIPVDGNVSFKSKFDEDQQILELQTYIMGYITKEQVDFKSQAIRDALIGMGWTPPETEHE